MCTGANQILIANPASVSCAGDTQCQQACCTTAVCAPIPGKEGYGSGCSTANTDVSGECTVSCATGYSGANTVYTCQFENGVAAFKPNGAENTCLPITYAMWNASLKPAVEDAHQVFAQPRHLYQVRWASKLQDM